METRIEGRSLPQDGEATVPGGYESASAGRVVKVRLDASGRRLVGHVVLNPGEYRISDRLNNPDPFFFVLSDGSSNGQGVVQRAILKDAVSYVAALAEPDRPEALREDGSFHRTTIELIRPALTLVGELFIPSGATIATVLNDTRRFVNLRHVSFSDAPENYAYLALAKSQTRMWEVHPDG